MIGNSSFKVGIYIRLSRDDGNIESDSIISQRSLLNQYIKENNYSLIDEYVDDGFTGTNFERPSFKRMIKDIESGKINMIITKDMSRLGRDYIGTGELIEKYFPNKNVRYIAINDGIDTFIDNTNNDIAPFKAIMNDMYAKDISKKVKTSLHSRMKEGLYVSGRCPFGYMKDPNNKNHLVVNNEQAEVVKLIFDLALKGNTYHYIAQKLTKRKIKTPASYYNYVWNTKCSTECISQEYGVWVDTTIKAILTNRIYVGDVVQGKTKKINYKLKKTVKNKPNDFIIVENTHEAIIDRDTFNYVQTLLPKNVKRPEKKRFYLLDGLLYCGDCSIWFNTVLRGDVNSIRIGNGVNIQDGSVLHTLYQKSTIEIGDHVSVGHNVTIHGATIKDYALVGMGSTVLDHVVVGEGAIVAAGSLVLSNTIIEPGSIWGGVPAKFIKKVDPEQAKELNQKIAHNYLMYSQWYKEDK